MEGQTTIEPCAFCGEPAEEQRVIRDSHQDSKGRLIARVTKWVCAKHAAACDRDMGWKERQAKERAAERRRLKKLQETSVLFDGDDGVPPGLGKRAS